jgi:hypothetical protein
MCKKSDADSMVSPPSQGSRRRRLWELDGHAHCPVIGVCLPIGALRRMVDKALGGQAVADDYDMHCGVVADCKLRTPLAEALQRELDRRYTLSLRQAARPRALRRLLPGGTRPRVARTWQGPSGPH